MCCLPWPPRTGAAAGLQDVAERKERGLSEAAFLLVSNVTLGKSPNLSELWLLVKMIWVR